MMTSLRCDVTPPQFIRKHYNVYSHGTLSATCEFGRFQPFPNCCHKKGTTIHYVNTLKPRTEPLEESKLKAALGELGFQPGISYDRVK